MTRQPPPGNLSAVAALVRRADPDRFFCALFAPPARREAVLLLAAVNHELARAREAVSLPPLALIRLQWWREVADGARRAHDVAGPLGAALDAGVVLAAEIHAMVDAREAEADDVPDFAAWQALVRGTAGGLAVAQARVLGADPAAMARVGELAAGLWCRGPAFATSRFWRGGVAACCRWTCWRKRGSRPRRWCPTRATPGSIWCGDGSRRGRWVGSTPGAGGSGGTWSRRRCRACWRGATFGGLRGRSARAASATARRFCWPTWRAESERRAAVPSPAKR